MDRLIIEGGHKLEGNISITGAKNVAMKVILTGLLTKKEIVVENVPLITSVYGTADLVNHLGVNVKIFDNHTMRIKGNGLNGFTIPLDMGGLYRTATMVIGPLLQRFGKAIVPNPGGCRLGKRPVDWHISGLKALGAHISYKDGFFYATAKKLKGARFKFAKNTHTGTETLILAAVKAEGETVIENASLEPEVDDLIRLINQMGGKIKRKDNRVIVISGVKKLNGADFNIMPDRNEAVTFAVGAICSGGRLLIKGAREKDLSSFLGYLKIIGAGYRIAGEDTIEFSGRKKLKPSNITTGPYPGFMTDWQAPWALMMTQAAGMSSVHESVFEDRFSYVEQLSKMGANIVPFKPLVKKPAKFYNFNWSKKPKDRYQAISIHGKTPLHEAVLEVADLRAGATLVLAAVIAGGKSIIYGIDHIDRGCENIASRLGRLGVPIKRLKD